MKDIYEVPEEVSPEFAQQMDYSHGYPDFDEEPIPKQSVPTPQPMMTNYKEVRDQKKWMKVNLGLPML